VKSAIVSDDQIIDNLQELGFTLNDARVYLALVHYGPSTPAELATRCGVDRTRVYDSVKRLAAQHFVGQESAKSRPKYWAEDPATVFQEIQQKLADKIKISEKLLPSLEARFNAPEMPHEKYWNVEGGAKIKNIIKSIIENAGVKLTLIITPDFLIDSEIPWILKAVLQRLPKFPGKKANVQVILPISTLEVPEKLIGILNDIQGQGATIFDFSSKLMPFGLYLNEKSFLFIPASEFGATPIYESGIWIEDAKTDKLLGFSHLADWFLRLTREGLLTRWQEKSKKGEE
jgi:sugar-specific transcriptional regulator TrmB